MRKRLLIGLAVFLLSGVVGLFMLSRPAVLNLLGRHAGPLLGFRFELADLHLAFGEASARGLVITTATLQARIPQVRATGSLLGMRIEDVDLEGATFRYVYDPQGPAFDLRAYVEGLPSVKRLRVRRSCADVTSKDGAWRAQAGSLEVSVDDFSPRGGGSFKLSSRVKLRTRDGATEAQGPLSGSGRLSALVPRPVGKAVLAAELSGKAAGRSFQALKVELPLEAAPSGIIRLAGASVAARQLQVSPQLKLAQARLTLPATIDLSRRRFTLTQAKAEAAGLGTVRLEAGGGWSAGSPLSLDWRATAGADALDVARLKEIAGGLSPTLAEWQAGGKASLAAELSGRYRQGLSYRGDVRLRLAGGSFSSPDFTKAGEGISATVHLRLERSTPEKVDLEAGVSLPQGQLLAGGVLADLAEVRPEVRASGCFFLRRPIAL
jgi:hypothetical protein